MLCQVFLLRISHHLFEINRFFSASSLWMVTWLSIIFQTLRALSEIASGRQHLFLLMTSATLALLGILGPII